MTLRTEERYTTGDPPSYPGQIPSRPLIRRAFYYPTKNPEGEIIGWTLRPEFGRRPIGQGVTQDEARDDFVRQIQEEMDRNHR